MGALVTAVGFPRTRDILYPVPCDSIVKLTRVRLELDKFPSLGYTCSYNLT